MTYEQLFVIALTIGFGGAFVVFGALCLWVKLAGRKERRSFPCVDNSKML